MNEASEYGNPCCQQIAVSFIGACGVRIYPTSSIKAIKERPTKENQRSKANAPKPPKQLANEMKMKEERKKEAGPPKRKKTDTSNPNIDPSNKESMLLLCRNLLKCIRCMRAIADIRYLSLKR